LTRDAEQQKYFEIAALVSITVGREQFRKAEPRFYTAWVKRYSWFPAGPDAKSALAGADYSLASLRSFRDRTNARSVAMNRASISGISLLGSLIDCPLCAARISA
jgi:hypothetical protein